MTAFATCLFVLAALVSGWVVVSTSRRYGADALALRAQLAACPHTIEVWWRSVERRRRPALGVVSTRLERAAPGLEWPGSSAALTLAA